MVAPTNTQVKIVAVGRITNGRTELRTDPAFAPATVPVSAAFASGLEDAIKGDAFFPESWGWGIKRIEYTKGFLAGKPDNEPALAYRAGFISQGYDNFYADRLYSAQWNEWMRQGWQEAADELDAVFAEKEAKPGLNTACDCEDEEIGRCEFEQRHGM